MRTVGTKLRRIVKKSSLLALFQAYSYAALLSSGPWIISIVAILFIGFINIATYGNTGDSVRFQIIVTYAFAVASSLIITGMFQLPFTRYVSDLIFCAEEQKVLPVFFGTLLLTIVTSFFILTPLAFFIFRGESFLFIILVIATFIILCALWITNILAAGLKLYHRILFAYLFAYSLIALLAYVVGFNMQMLLLSFLIGNALLLTYLVTLIIQSYPSRELIRFDFFTDKRFYWSLGVAGLFYNLGTWVDKFIFWYHPLTGEYVIGKLKASVVYDMPIFLAYLSIIPGMAALFYRLETTFADKYEIFFEAIRQSGTLFLIRQYKEEMIRSIRLIVRELLVMQGIINILLFLSAPKVFEALKMPQLYLGLFYIDTIGAQLQLGFMAVLALLYYMDRKKEAMWLSILFFVLNGLFSLLTIYMGPAMFGYGYAGSLLVCFVISLMVMRKVMERVEYETFMLQ